MTHFSSLWSFAAILVVEVDSVVTCIWSELAMRKCTNTATTDNKIIIAIETKANNKSFFSVLVYLNWLQLSNQCMYVCKRLQIWL